MSEIKTARLVLRPWKKPDGPALQRLANNRKVWMGLREIFPHPYEEKDAVAWIAQQTKDPKQYQFAMEYSREAIGGISLHLLEDVHQKTAEIGYWLGEPFWGQGLGTEAVLAISDWGLDELPIIRIQAGIFSNNQASIRVMEKAGFKQEGYLERSVFKAGQVLDEIIFAKLKE